LISQFLQGHDIGDKPTDSSSTPSLRPLSTPDRLGDAKKKKKGIFGGLFGGKKGKKTKDDKSERTSSRTRALRSPIARKGKTEV